MRRSVWVAMIAVFLLSGCGKLTKREGAAPGQDLETIDTVVEETQPVERAPEETARQAEPQEPVEEPAVAAVPEEEAVPPPPPEPEPAASFESRFLPGYRVQLMATTEPDQAREFAESVRPLFEENVYVEYLEPYYKVRIGDCRTRENATLLLNKARTRGFEEAWITSTQIIEKTEVLR